MFDMHIGFDKGERPVFSYRGHQLIGATPGEVLGFINHQKGCVVRLMYSPCCSRKKSIKQREVFFKYCQHVAQFYRNISFFGGRLADEPYSSPIYLFKFEHDTEFRLIDPLKKPSG